MLLDVDTTIKCGDGCGLYSHLDECGARLDCCVADSPPEDSIVEADGGEVSSVGKGGAGSLLALGFESLRVVRRSKPMDPLDFSLLLLAPSSSLLQLAPDSCDLRPTAEFSSSGDVVEVDGCDSMA